MMSKKYTLSARNVGRLPRSKRLRQLGEGSGGNYGTSTVTVSTPVIEGTEYSIATKDYTGLMSGAMVRTLDWLYNNYWTVSQMMGCMDGWDSIRDILGDTTALCQHAKRDVILGDIVPQITGLNIDTWTKVGEVSFFMAGFESGSSQLPHAMVQRFITVLEIDGDGNITGHVDSGVKIWERYFAIGIGDTRGWSSWEDHTPALSSDLSGKQATLVSGTNIKTVNGQSLLGEGNIDVTGGGSSSVSVFDVLTSTSTTDALSANMGRELKRLVDLKVSTSQLNNYSTTSQADQRYLLKTGSITASQVSDFASAWQAQYNSQKSATVYDDLDTRYVRSIFDQVTIDESDLDAGGDYYLGDMVRAVFWNGSDEGALHLPDDVEVGTTVIFFDYEGSNAATIVSEGLIGNSFGVATSMRITSRPLRLTRVSAVIGTDSIYWLADV